MMTHKPFFLLALLALCCASITGRAADERSYPLPHQVGGVTQAVHSLNGTWSFQYAPKGKWVPIEVPGEVAMQGFAIEHDKPFTYRKSFTVPADFSGKRIILRFDGVYSHAKLSVNGTPVREHHGGFTRWESDITDRVKVGRKNELTLEVTDRLDDISYASGYAHHLIGGILRDVTLFALPAEPMRNVVVETALDTLYRDAQLTFGCVVEGDRAGTVEFSLTDPTGKPVALPQSAFRLANGVNRFELPVQSPEKWDAEHPNLYTLWVSMTQNGQPALRFSRQVGFRKIEVVKDQLLVNGNPVKLRGACRHDIHPTLGRTTTRAYDSLDVVLFKQSNMNFVRTSHYPPTERFLEFCDRYGIYVECETAVCFVDTYRQKNYAPANSQDDPNFTDRYLGQCQEMVHSLRNHASIVMWSIGNESIYGTNFQRSWDWIKATDTTRPVIFSYPGTVKDKDKPVYDILSMHYQNVQGNVTQFGMSTRNFQGHGIPALFDEWAHPPCYTYATLQNDPNIREFWGQSLDMMWSGLFKSRGGLGGATWGYIDETFALPEPKVGTPFWKEFAHTAKPEGFRGNCVGYGQWGIVDIWRREKPEFWATKKAYSPVRLEADNALAFTPGQRVALTLYNRFDHTWLNEIKGSYTYQGQKHSLTLPAVAPHAKGILVLPARPWVEGEEVLIEFFTPQGELIDAYRHTLGAERIDLPKPLSGTTLTVEQNDQQTVVVGQGFRIPFDKKTGLIANATAGDRVVIEQGPFVHLDINLNHLTGAEVRKMAHNYSSNIAQWQLQSFDCQQQSDGMYVTVRGTYEQVAVDFTIRITPQGSIQINYTTNGAPNGFLRETGLAFRLGAFEELEWKRRGYWNHYPQGAFAGNEGSTPLTNGYVPAYGQEPRQAWKDDTHDYYYWADRGTDTDQPLRLAAKGMKEHIYYYTLKTGAQQLSVVSPDASVACRLQQRPNQGLFLYTNNRWDYPEIAWGNYCKTLEALPCYGTIELQLR